MTEPVVSLHQVGVRFPVPRLGRRMGRIPRLIGASRWTHWGLRGVNHDVAQGEVVGLIGPNGSGKTTLLRTVAAIYRPDEGHAVVRGRVGPMLSASAGLKSDLSGWDNIELSGVLLGLSRRSIRSLAPDIIEFAELGRFRDAPIRVYSVGMRARLGFAIALFTEPDILALDEIMSAMDQDFRERSEEALRRFITSGRTVLTAGHDIEHLTETCTRLVRLEAGGIVEDGDPAEVGRRYLEAPARPAPEAGGHGNTTPLRTEPTSRPQR